MCYEERPYDYGFDEPDNSYLFTTVDGEKIELMKNRNWFENHETLEMDFYITWSVMVNKSVFITFPKGVSKDLVIDFASKQWVEDKEETEEHSKHEQELYWEHKMMLRGIQW